MPSKFTYPLTKTKGIDDHPNNDNNFFYQYASKLTLSCADFKVKVTTTMGEERVYLLFNELVDCGNPNFVCIFSIEEDTIYNFQNITNSGNKIFINHSRYVFKHYLKNDIDKVDLYFDDVLTYQDLTIEIEE